jgi:hypothetical protein
VKKTTGLLYYFYPQEHRLYWIPQNNFKFKGCAILEAYRWRYVQLCSKYYSVAVDFL